jgi:hypothetical protein
MDYVMTEDELSTDDGPPDASSELSFPSPPTHAFDPTGLVCGEASGHTEGTANEESDQAVASTPRDTGDGSNDGENDAIAQLIAAMEADGRMAQTGMTPKDVSRIGSHFGPATTEKLVDYRIANKITTPVHMEVNRTATATDNNGQHPVQEGNTAAAFMTPMKNGKGKAIQLTPTFRPSPGITIHQPFPTSASNLAMEDTGSPALFSHIIGTVLGQNDKSPIRRALLYEGFDSLPSLAAMDDRIIESLSFRDGDQEVSGLGTISDDDAKLLRGFRKFIALCISQGKTLASDWYQMTGNDFEMFRYQCLPESQWEPTVAPTADVSGTLSTNRDDAMSPTDDDDGNISPIPFSIFNHGPSTLLSLPTTPVAQPGEMGQQDAGTGGNEDTSLDTSLVRLEDLLDQAFQGGMERGIAKATAYLSDPASAHGENPFELDDLLAKAIAFGEAYGISTKLIAVLCYSGQHPIASGHQAETAGMHTPPATVPTQSPATVTKGNSARAPQTTVLRSILRTPTIGFPTVASHVPNAPMVESMLENLTLLRSWKYPHGATEPNFVVGYPLKRTRQDEGEETNPKVKMRSSTPWGMVDQQSGSPTSNEWGVSII